MKDIDDFRRKEKQLETELAARQVIDAIPDSVKDVADKGFEKIVDGFSELPSTAKGAIAGAAIGSMVPVVGTVVGGLIGGAIGFFKK